MFSRRLRLSFAAVALITLGALAGCDKPTPLVGMVANGEYINAEATIWCFGDDVYTGPGSCTERQKPAPKLKVHSGDQVSVEVSSDVADKGWYIAIAAESTVDPSAKPAGEDKTGSEQQFQRGPVQKDSTYFSFTVPQFKSAPMIPVQVIALGKGKSNTGIWQFLLVNAEI